MEIEKLDSKMIEEIIRRVLERELQRNNKEFIKRIDEESGIALIKTETFKPEKFDTGKEGDRVYLKDVLTLEESPRIGCGVMEMHESIFDWTLKYDEIDYIIDGSLEIIVGDKKIVGEKGDILFIPKNTSIKFSSPNYSRFIYIVYPANWDQL